MDTCAEAGLAAFEAAHPGVRVTWVDIAYDAARSRKLIAAAAAGRAAPTW
jgi:ABC-type glycerol-3-phosphate transport system substrate-binding protein